VKPFVLVAPEVREAVDAGPAVAALDAGVAAAPAAPGGAA